MKILRLLSLLLIFSAKLYAQETVLDKQITGELKMKFPGVYFKHNSTEYAKMPYTADSCFKYIAKHMKDIYSYVIWRDSSETEELTNKRIKKIKSDLNKFISYGKVEIHSMGADQKISRQTINLATNDEQRRYLLSLNSVFDISTRRISVRKKNHIERPRIWCLNCWTSGFHIKARRQMREMAKKQAAPAK